MHNFPRKYHPHIYRQPQTQLKPLAGQQLKAICIVAKKSAAGLDNFSPDDFAQLSNLRCEWLAFARNLVAAGEPWPNELLRGKAAYLAKDPNHTEARLAYRVLLILPALPTLGLGSTGRP